MEQNTENKAAEAVRSSDWLGDEKHAEGIALDEAVSLRARLATESARLDWLVSNSVRVTKGFCQETLTEVWVVSERQKPSFGNLGVAGTMRGAIDEAMRKVQSPNEVAERRGEPDAERNGK